MISATADGDKAFWNLHVTFSRAPDFMNLVPSTAQLRRAARSGEEQFAETAELVHTMLEPVAAWRSF